MKQLTVRGFDEELERTLRELARREGISLNKAALRLMRRGAGLAQVRGGENRIGDALDGHFGTWTEKQTREFEEALAHLGKIDPEQWR